jgi:hypothetical protein
MKRAHEELFGLLFGLTFPVIAGFGVAVSIYVDGICSKSLIMLFGWLAATGFYWSLPVILQRIAGRKTVLRDERDVAIWKRSALTAHAASWLYFFAACVVALWIAGADGAISVNALPLTFVGGIVVFQVALVLSSYLQERTGRIHGG